MSERPTWIILQPRDNNDLTAERDPENRVDVDCNHCNLRQPVVDPTSTNIHSNIICTGLQPDGTINANRQLSQENTPYTAQRARQDNAVSRCGNIGTVFQQRFNPDKKLV